MDVEEVVEVDVTVRVDVDGLKAAHWDEHDGESGAPQMNESDHVSLILNVRPNAILRVHMFVG